MPVIAALDPAANPSPRPALQPVPHETPTRSRTLEPMPWVETASLSFTARHDTGDAAYAERTLDRLEDLRLRLAMDMLGIPFKYVTGYRSSPAARLAFQRGEINFFSESPPSYRGVVDPSLVKTGQAIPVFYDAGFDGKDFFVPDAVKGLPILTFHELYQKIKGTMPSGQLWDIYKAIIAADGIIQRLIVMPPGVPQPAVDALRAAIARVNVDPAYAEEAEKAFGFVPQWAAGPDTPKVAQTALTVRPEVRTFLTDYMKNLPK